MTPTPSTGAPAAAPPKPTPTTLVVSHPSTLTGAQILSIVNAAVDQDAPVVVQAIPGGTSPQISAYVTLGELGLGIVNQIVQAIQAAHAATKSSS